MALTQNQREKEDGTRDFAVGVVGNLVAALLVFWVNVLGARFLPAASRKLLDMLSIVVPLALLLLFLYRGHLGRVKRFGPSLLLALVATVFLIVGFGLVFRWMTEGRVQNVERLSPAVYNIYGRLYDLIGP